MRVHCRFIAMPNRPISDIVRELAETMGDNRPDNDELLRLARELQSIPHWFEADYDKRPAATPGFAEFALVPGTLRDLGPATLEEMKAHLAQQLELVLAAEKHRRRISFCKMCPPKLAHCVSLYIHGVFLSAKRQSLRGCLRHER